MASFQENFSGPKALVPPALLPPKLTILEKSFLTTKHAGLTLVQDSRGNHKNKQQTINNEEQTS